MDVTLPPRLPPGWARVRVTQAGLCASDLHVIRLAVSPSVAPSAMLGNSTAPVVLGHELVGVVEEVSGDVPLPVGQRVISRSAGFRNCHNLGADLCPRCRDGEYVFCDHQGDPPPPHEPVRGGAYAPMYLEHAANLLPVPDELNNDEALLAEPLATPLRAVLAMSGDSPSRVLVVGAGLQGLGAVHWLTTLHPQAEVTCTARHPFQAELARRLGTRHVLSGRPSTADLAAHLASPLARGIAGNNLVLRGFDVTFDSIGSPATLHAALRCTRPGGVVIVIGAYLFPGRLDYSPVWFREVQVRGVYAHGMETHRGRRIGTLALTLELLATTGRINVPLVTHHIPLAQYRAAISLMDAKAASRTVRVALVPA